MKNLNYYNDLYNEYIKDTNDEYLFPKELFIITKYISATGVQLNDKAINKAVSELKAEGETELADYITNGYSILKHAIKELN